jgi:3-deoxy-D-manno-octulosonic-acid transferase
LRVLILWNLLCGVLWPVLYLYAPFRGTIGQRLGRFELGSYDPDSRGLKVLLNAVSAGEVVAVSGLVRELKQREPDAQIVLLTTTRSGMTMAQQRLGDQLALTLYFPLIDLWWVVRRYLTRLGPDVYITTEAELWPNMQTQCRRRGIPVVLVNGRLYMHNKRGPRLTLIRWLLGQLSLIVATNVEQRDNFIAVGVPAERIAVSGNLKFDVAVEEWDKERDVAWAQRFAIQHGLTVVGGSTHPGEEELLLGSLSELRAEGFSVKLVLAPRHIDRAAAVVSLARSAGFAAALLSQHQRGAPWDVLVVDSYGVLQDIYRLATIVVMGGTFSAKVGGHNLLEATVLGKQIIVGPHTFSITAQLQLLESTGAVLKLPEASHLGPRLRQLLQSAIDNREAFETRGLAGRAATLANRGAAARTVDAVMGLLQR